MDIPRTLVLDNVKIHNMSITLNLECNITSISVHSQQLIDGMKLSNKLLSSWSIPTNSVYDIITEQYLDYIPWVLILYTI